MVVLDFRVFSASCNKQNKNISFIPINEKLIFQILKKKTWFLKFSHFYHFSFLTEKLKIYKSG